MKTVTDEQYRALTRSKVKVVGSKTGKEAKALAEATGLGSRVLVVKVGKNNYQLFANDYSDYKIANDNLRV